MNTVYQFLFACRNFREVRESLVVPDISLCEPVFAIRLYLKKNRFGYGFVTKISLRKLVHLK